MKTWVVVRRSSQTAFFLLFIYILWSTTYPLSGILPTETFFIIDPLIMIFTSVSERIILPGVQFSILLLVLTAVLGRFFCGWICPLGSTIDMAGARTKHLTLYGKFPAWTRFIKYGILSVTALGALFGIQLAWVFDPTVIIARFISLNLIPTITLLIDKCFILAIQQLHLYGPVHDFYRMLKSSILGIKPYYFSSSLIIFVFFLLILIPVIFMKRFWCRAVCPLGALYALTAQFSLLERVIGSCTHCKQCTGSCRMGAILDDSSYRKEECIVCMDCIYDCPPHRAVFKFRLPYKNKKSNSLSVSRRNFMFLLFSAAVSLSFKNRRRFSGRRYGSIIRPPGSIKEVAFINRCVRCGNCMKVCITNGLQPTFTESGLSGIWTPRLVPEIGYCEFNCTLCGEVCPTDAITELTQEKKHKTKIGIAVINEKICLPFAEGKECIVCEEHCPTYKKAIQLKSYRLKNKMLLRPSVVKKLCIGCAICQTKCPTRPERAIKIFSYT